MGPFNNREIATAFWILVFIVCALRNTGIRKSVMEVVRAFCCFKILVPVCLMLFYTAVVVAILDVFGFWKIDFLKDTIVWFCVSAMAMMVQFVTSDDSKNIFREVLVDSFKIVIVLEFLINTYTFSLPAELIIIPILTLIAIVDAVPGIDIKYSKVTKFTQTAQIIFGFGILVIISIRAINDLQNLHSLETLKSIIITPLLSLSLTPFLYIMVLFSKYEILFLRLGFGIEKDKGLERYARRQIIMHIGLSMKRLQHFLKNHAVDIMHIQTKADIDRLIEINRGN